MQEVQKSAGIAGIGRNCRNRQELQKSAGIAGIGRNCRNRQELQELHFYFYSKV
jgi:hypothetical protein